MVDIVMHALALILTYNHLGEVTGKNIMGISFALHLADDWKQCDSMPMFGKGVTNSRHRVTFSKLIGGSKPCVQSFILNPLMVFFGLQ